MRYLSLLILLCMTACAPWRHASYPSGAAVPPDSLQIDRGVGEGETSGLRAARWYLLRALEANSCGLYPQAQNDLDQAFHILSAVERDEDAAAQIQHLAAAVEAAYLNLLPHLERFSPDSPLVLLLEGLSEEKIESLPADATPLVRIHQLSSQCDVPIDANEKVAASIHFFQTRGRATFESWMRRSGRFRALIDTILVEEGVPRDLLYVAMIESGFNPHASSRARAVGLWQFMAGTGRLQGLHRSHWVDERRDPVKSTRAAARHLRGLYAKFQDWRLAIAAYNSGMGRVARAVARADTADFWQLDLPRETVNYVPLFMAATIIAKDPELFGFELSELDPPYRYDEVALPSSLPYVDLKSAASSIGSSYIALRNLNPELRQRITPPGKRGYRLRLPPGKGEGFLERYARLPQAEKPALYRYEVQRRDNLSSIAQAFGIGSRLIADANSITDPNRIYPGQILYIPAAAGIQVRPAHEKTTYRVRRGDSLSLVARKHGVRLRDLIQWNGLDHTVIHPGDQLVIWSPKATVTPMPVGKQSRSLTGDGAFHIVQKGETLWGLSRSLGVSVEQLREWNGLQGAFIRVGQKLIVAPPETEEEQEIYTVVQGDTLYSIARKFGLQAQELARRNNISLSTTLLTGMTLKIETENGE